MTLFKTSSVYEVSPIPIDNNIHKITDESLKIQVDIMIGIREYNCASANVISCLNYIPFIHLNLDKINNLNNTLKLINAFNKNLREHCKLFEISYNYNIESTNLLSRMKNITIHCDKLCKI